MYVCYVCDYVRNVCMHVMICMNVRYDIYVCCVMYACYVMCVCMVVMPLLTYVGSVM